MTNKDLLRQYVDTGIQINSRQYRQLPPNILKTYIRKRIIAGNLTWDEYKVMPEELTDSFYQNTTSESNAINELFKTGRVNDDIINRIIDVKGKKKLADDEYLITLMVGHADDDLQVGKKLFDLFGSDIYPMFFMNIIRESKIDVTRPILINYFIENYLNESPYNGDRWNNITQHILLKSSYYLLDTSRKIINVMGSKLGYVECGEINSYLFENSYNEDYVFSDVMIEFIDEIKNHPKAGELTFQFLKNLTPNEIHKVMSTIDKRVSVEMSRYQYPIIQLGIKTASERSGEQNFAYANAIVKYIPLNNLEPKFVEILNAYAKEYKKI